LEGCVFGFVLYPQGRRDVDFVERIVSFEKVVGFYDLATFVVGHLSLAFSFLMASGGEISLIRSVGFGGNG
jgi:hypothetical protein